MRVDRAYKTLSARSILLTLSVPLNLSPNGDFSQLPPFPTRRESRNQNVPRTDFSRQQAEASQIYLNLRCQRDDN
jgi:hypothetical protein